MSVSPEKDGAKVDADLPEAASAGSGAEHSELEDLAYKPTFSDFVEAWGAPTLKERIDGLYNLGIRTRLARTIIRFVDAKGNLLSAGISFMMIFSLSAAVTLLGGLFTLTVGQSARIRNAVIASLNSWLPGLVKTPENPEGMISPDVLTSAPGASVTSLVALVITVYSATRVVASLALGIRAMFGYTPGRTKFIAVVWGRIAGLFTLFLGVVSTAIFFLLSGRLRSYLSGILGHEAAEGLNTAFYVITVLATLTVDFFVIVIFIRYIAGINPPRRELFQGALLGAVGTTGLRELGTVVVGSVSGAVLTAAASLITLIVWVNLQARVVLLASAWTANPPLPLNKTPGVEVPKQKSPNYATLSDPSTLQHEVALRQAISHQNYPEADADAESRTKHSGQSS